MRILVTGATGAIGPQVVQALCEAGHALRTFSLDRPALSALPPNAEERTGDVTDKAAVQSAMHGVGAIVHLAALLHIVNPLPSLRARYEQINVGGTATVVDAAVKAGIKRVVLASTISVYGPSNGQILNEDSVPHPDTFYAQTKLAAEKIVLNARNADGQPIGTVLRFGAVYGSRIKGNYERLVRALARHRFVPIGNGRNRRTLVYDKDVARAIVLAIQHPAAAGKIYNVTDGQFHELREIISAISSALGRKPPRYSIPVAPVRIAAGILEDAVRLIGFRSPISRATIDKYLEDIAVEGRRVQTEFGFVPQYDLQAGWRNTVSEMRKTGEL